MSRQTSHEEDCVTCEAQGKQGFRTFHRYNPPAGRCEVCSEPIKVMAFKNTGVCSEICRKVRDKEEIGDFESRTPG